MSTSALLRLSPLMTPVMHPVSVRIHHWYVPYRIIWDEFEDFITGGIDGLGPPGGFPANNWGTVPEKSLMDYMGVPTGTGFAGAGLSLSALPNRAYNKVFNEFYRDQDLVPEVDEDAYFVQRIAWEKDWFTAARPWTQRGPEVTLPLSGVLPVNVKTPLAAQQWQTTAGVNVGQLNAQSGAGSNALFSGGTGGATAGTTWLNPQLEALLNAQVPINDVRTAFALQRYAEARAQFGTRYTEYLRYLGVRSSDARLQRPEYLGGGRATISFSEVLKTGEGDTPTDDSPIGELRGHGISALRSRRFIRFFEEHGIVLTLASIRPRTMYTDGLPKWWSRRVKEDFWQKELELIGQQEVKNQEVYAKHATPDGTFGYNDRYGEYRHIQSYVTGDFRSTMNDWHLARSFASAPALNQSFISCDPGRRIFAEQTADPIWAMFSHSIQARRMVGNRTIGRVM